MAKNTNKTAPLHLTAAESLMVWQLLNAKNVMVSPADSKTMGGLYAKAKTVADFHGHTDPPPAPKPNDKA